MFLIKKLLKKNLISLPKNFEHIVAAIEESKDITTLSVEQLMGSLKSHEQRSGECILNQTQFQDNRNPSKRISQGMKKEIKRDGNEEIPIAAEKTIKK